MVELPHGVERVIADGLRFKQRLHIGQDAYALLRTRTTLLSLAEAGLAGGSGAAVASSTAVASSFFAPALPAGVLGWLGLAAPAAAVTPVGWVIAAGLVAGGGYFGLKRWLASGPDQWVDTIPKFINTPLDLLGAGLFDMTAALSMRVARADGHVDESERDLIAEHFVTDWGYDPAYVAATLPITENREDPRRLSVLARALAEFQAGNPDCNGPAMQAELLDFLRELVRADGKVTLVEERAVRAIEMALTAEQGYVSHATARRVRSLAETVGTAASGIAARLRWSGSRVGDAALRDDGAASEG
jgi:uncharacterized membrane protein YebE (DUF533 family)